MVKRCIMIFPKFENMEVINKIREKYDPLAKHVAPHITLVFPFDSDIKTSNLRDHIESIVSEIKPFDIVLQGITPMKSYGNYLFLGVKKGFEEIIKLHDRLYTGILKNFLIDRKYLPHMTVGLLDNDEEFKAAAEAIKDVNEVFKILVTAISVEIIDEIENSIIELEIQLKNI